MKHLVLAILFGACTADSGGSSTGSTCPSTNAPTYDNFGRTFMTTYCTGCHSATAQNRFGAPPSLNFDSEAEITRHASAIDQEAARGPKAANDTMPELGTPLVQSKPTDDEREKLGQFLACLK